MLKYLANVKIAKSSECHLYLYFLKKSKKKDNFQVSTAIGEEMIKEAGGKEHVTVTDLEPHGSTAVYIIPPLDYRALSADVFKKM